MTMIAEIATFATGIVAISTPALIIWVKSANDTRHKETNERIEELEVSSTEKFESLQEALEKQQEVWQDYDEKKSVCKRLDNIASSSIEYTKSGNKINTFKYQIRDIIKMLSMNILNTGFSYLTTAKLNAYFALSRIELIKAGGYLPDDFIELIREPIRESTVIYKEQLMGLVEDSKFNDKLDRFKNYTERYLRDNLMLITTKWWKYN